MAKGKLMATLLLLLLNSDSFTDSLYAKQEDKL